MYFPFLPSVDTAYHFSVLKSHKGEGPDLYVKSCKVAVVLLGSFFFFFLMNTFGSRTKPQEWVIETFPVFTVLFSFLETNISSHLCIGWYAQRGCFMKKWSIVTLGAEWGSNSRNSGYKVPSTGPLSISGGYSSKYHKQDHDMVHIVLIHWKVMESLESFKENT